MCSIHTGRACKAASEERTSEGVRAGSEKLLTAVAVDCGYRLRFEAVAVETGVAVAVAVDEGVMIVAVERGGAMIFFVEIAVAVAVAETAFTGEVLEICLPFERMALPEAVFRSLLGGSLD